MKTIKLRNLITEANSKPKNIVSYSRSGAWVILKKRDYKWEKKIFFVYGYNVKKVKTGYKYYFANDFDWEKALSVLGI